MTTTTRRPSCRVSERLDTCLRCQCRSLGFGFRPSPALPISFSPRRIHSTVKASSSDGQALSRPYPREGPRGEFENVTKRVRTSAIIYRSLGPLEAECTAAAEYPPQAPLSRLVLPCSPCSTAHVTPIVICCPPTTPSSSTLENSGGCGRSKQTGPKQDGPLPQV